MLRFCVALERNLLFVRCLEDKTETNAVHIIGPPGGFLEEFVGKLTAAAKNR